MDVLGDNREEVILCAYDGLTYIVDHDGNVVQFRFRDKVKVNNFCCKPQYYTGKIGYRMQKGPRKKSVVM